MRQGKSAAVSKKQDMRAYTGHGC